MNDQSLPTLSLTQSQTSPADQITAVRQLLQRVIPQHHDLFHLELDGDSKRTYFHVEVRSSKIRVKGTSAIELSAGVGWFLKYRCSASISWRATGGIQYSAKAFEPANLFELESAAPLHRERTFPYSYYLNPVTVSYSMAYWDWQRWEDEIDWMALHGINLVLAPSGQELVWLKVFRSLGLSDDELQDFFAGPSFLAWGRMGNVQGWGGPLPRAYMEAQHALQQRIVRRMRSLAIIPVLPAFAGFVPNALATHYPELPIAQLPAWAGFEPRYSCVHLLHPASDMFKRIGQLFVRQLRDDFGWDAVGFYACDTFNEMRPSDSSSQYLQSLSGGVYEAMAAGDSSATWILQAWLFFSDQKFWQPPQIKAFLSGVEAGKLILLDLFADVYPQWSRTEAFGGVPFIWCMLHNFGGNMGMYGTLDWVAHGPSDAAAYDGSHVVGVGIAPEGIEQNPVVYDFACELAFRNEPPNTSEWLQLYSSRRYAGLQSKHLSEAWRLLRATVYGCTDYHVDHFRDVPVSRPGMSPTEITGWGLVPALWYRLEDAVTAWRALLRAADELGNELSQQSSFRYDLVDVSREVLSKLATGHWRHIIMAFQSQDLAALRTVSQQLLGLLDDLDALLSCHEGFMLGRFLQQVREYAGSDADLQALYERNARTQISIWGTSPSGDSEVSDYANKEWSGMISSFYKPRWAAWLAYLESCLSSQSMYNPEHVQKEMVKHAHAWCAARDDFPTQPRGDVLVLSRSLLEKYAGHVLQDEVEVMCDGDVISDANLVAADMAD